MNGMILAAGLGTRLAALGLNVPKALVDVGGEPLLARQLRYLARQGVQHVVVNAHHLAPALESFAREYKSPPSVSVLFEGQLLGTAGGVRNALDLLGEDPVIVLYGDVVVHTPMAPMVALHRSLAAEATLAVYRSTDVVGKGTVERDREGLVRGFQEKAATSAAQAALINAGLYVLEPKLIADIPRGVALDFGHDVFPRAIEEGRRLAAYILDAPVIDVGTPEGLVRARAEFAAETKTPAARRQGDQPGCR